MVTRNALIGNGRCMDGKCFFIPFSRKCFYARDRLFMAFIYPSNLTHTTLTRTPTQAYNHTHPHASIHAHTYSITRTHMQAYTHTPTQSHVYRMQRYRVLLKKHHSCCTPIKWCLLHVSGLIMWKRCSLLTLQACLCRTRRQLRSIYAFPIGFVRS